MKIKIQNFLLFLLSKIVPRSRSIVVFGSSFGFSYTDNSMHLFKYAKNKFYGRSIWLTRSIDVLNEIRREGGQAYLIKSISGVWFGLRAGWHIHDSAIQDTGPTYIGANILNLWHGVPLKDIRKLKSPLEITGFLNKLSDRLIWSGGLRNHYYLVHPSRSKITDMLQTFKLFEKNVIYADLPRNYILHNNVDMSVWAKKSDYEVWQTLSSLKNNGFKLIGYFPTWRSDGLDKFLGEDDIEKLLEFDDYLQKRKIILVTKWHPCVYSEHQHIGANSAVVNFLRSFQSKSKSIFVLPSNSDLNTFLTIINALITDYSSVFFDYCKLSRPMIFMPYDKIEYSNNWGFFDCYESLIPGPEVRNIADLIKQIELLFANNFKPINIYESKSNNILDLYFDSALGPDEIISFISH